MFKRETRSLFTLFTCALACTIIASAQSAKVVKIQPMTAISSWELARLAGASKRKLFVVTFDQPQRKQACRVRAFTQDKLVCSRAIGGPRIYLPNQVLALILPGDGAVKLGLMLGINAELGAAIWGTVVLIATCPACAAATAFVSLYLFFGAGAIGMGDSRPDKLLYLAQGGKLTGKLRMIQPWTQQPK